MRDYWVAMTYTPAQLADRETIRDAVLRYCRGVDRLDAELMKSAYWPDAIDEHGAFSGNAHDFVEYCMTAHLKWRWTMHSVLNHSIDLDDDELSARGEVYNVTTMCRVDSAVIETWYGRYLDLYDKRGDEWRIQHRVCVYHGTQLAGASPMEMDTSNYLDGSFDRPSRGRPLGPPGAGKTSGRPTNQ